VIELVSTSVLGGCNVCRARSADRFSAYLRRAPARTGLISQ